MDQEFICNSSEGSPQQNMEWWFQPHTPQMRPLDTPLERIEDFSLGLMSLDGSLNLNEKEQGGSFLSEAEKREGKKRLKMSNYLQAMSVRKREYEQLYCNGNELMTSSIDCMQMTQVRVKRLKRLTEYL